MSTLDSNHIEAINTISHFLAHPQISSLIQCDPVEVIVLCPSAVLSVAEHLFSALETRSDLAKYLVISGGIGHSTSLLYQSVSRHPLYRSISNMIDTMPEARVMEMILEKYYSVSSMTQNGMKILIEDTSTNCGANAANTKEILQKAGGLVEPPRSMIIVQDPTMSLRTLASFRKVYEGGDVDMKACPTFVPRTALGGGGIVWDVPGLKAGNLWEMKRFLELIMGEIPRLRDDENGYGPRGKGFITHVDLPEDVERAYRVLRGILEHSR